MSTNARGTKTKVTETLDLTCPLCQTEDASPFYEDHRNYVQCPECSLVFVPPHQFLSSEEEKSMYDLHENSSNDPGYRQFLNRIFKPLSQILKPASYGLDFGSGPGPTLSLMFEEDGHVMEIYDCFYAPQTSVLKKTYDFITATEVIEHLHHPRQELDRLWSCLKVNGSLGIMTKRVLSQEAFRAWHYKNDITHVCFFSLDTFHWLAHYWNAKLTVPDKDVVIFTKTQ